MTADFIAGLIAFGLIVGGLCLAAWIELRSGR